MGIALQGLATLFLEAKRRPFSGRLLQLGRQDVYFDYPTLAGNARASGVPLSPVAKIGTRPNQWVPNVETIDDVTLFKSLGFDEVDSVDSSSYENPSFIQDFNEPLADAHKGKYDVVYDGGSLEHIFDIAVALRNITDLLKVGGRVIHESPTHNFIDHGFYQFCPGFFYDYYEANRYAQPKCYLVGMKPPLNHETSFRIFTYEPMMLEGISVGGFTRDLFGGCEILSTSFVAEKTAESTGSVKPMQRRYREWWSSERFQNKT